TPINAYLLKKYYTRQTWNPTIKLTETEPADVIVELSPYDHKNKTRTKVHLTYQALRSMTRLRNHEDSHLKALIYAYYLGKLLKTKPKTPA
ncbi:12629_t:CDS:2, partial [Cetraspora pellucida]